VLLEYPLFKNLFVDLFFILGSIVGLTAITTNKEFNIIPEIKENACLITHGIYRYVRHPMYTSLIVMFFGFFLFGSLLAKFFYLLLLSVLYLKATKEEKLWHCEDPKYAKYKNSSKMFLPFLV
jgi:protein-S-isoprenylcysteine O-methyltransferase Ste14